jgi:arsenate reductase-like glutaredoxin family protein
MNHPKYSDSTLMGYVLGNIDKETTKEITIDLVCDDNLKKRVTDFELELEALLGLTDDEWDDIIEKNEQFNDAKIANLSDAKKSTNSSSPIENDNFGSLVANFFQQVKTKLKNHLTAFSAASAMFGAIVANMMMLSSPAILTTKSASISEDSLVTRTVSVEKLSSISKINLNDPTVIRLKEALNKGINFVPASEPNKAIDIISDFKNTQDYQCKLAVTNGKYLIACKDRSGNWTIHQPK